jgi:hypothetical protein
MPHDGNPGNGRMRPLRAPWWGLAIALAAVFAAGIAAVAAATGTALIALPAIAAVALGYAIYRMVLVRGAAAAGFMPGSRRPTSFRSGAIADGRVPRRRARMAGRRRR